MKLIFKKGFKGDISTLPKRTVDGAVQFKEFKSIKQLSFIANVIGTIIMAAAAVPLVWVYFSTVDYSEISLLIQFYVTFVLYIISMFVHEVLHALCFKGEVEFYTYLKRGMMFVIGTESMSKSRFVFMSMLPNLVFGFIPYILFFLFFRDQFWLGLFGVFSLGSGAGDYINVFNAITQMPKGSLCYMSGEHSFWYMPKVNEK